LTLVTYEQGGAHRSDICYSVRIEFVEARNRRINGLLIGS